MARAINKSIASATVYAFDGTKQFEIDDNGMPLPNITFSCDGNPSKAKAQRLAEKFVGHKNVMVLSIDVDETKIAVASDIFFLNSTPCVEGESYGREFVTQTFKLTQIGGFCMTENGMQLYNGYYLGETTDNKLLNYAKADCGSSMVTITTKKVIEERRFMTRDKYLSLAR